jgi:hypothetical protein
MIAWAIQLLWVLFARRCRCRGVRHPVVLETILGLPLPQRAIQIIWGLVALLAIIFILTWLAGGVSLNFPKLSG